MISRIAIGLVAVSLCFSTLVLIVAVTAYNLGVRAERRMSEKRGRGKDAAKQETSLCGLFDTGVRDHSQPPWRPYAAGRFPVAHRPGAQSTRLLPPIDFDEVAR